MDSLFDEAEERAAREAAPLAVRMRPRTLDEVIGQGTSRRRDAIPQAHRQRRAMSLVLWGPPGTGKTTLAYVVSQVTKRRFTELSAVTAGVKDVRAAVDAARRELGLSGRQTVLFVDEVHRFSKAQQDALLPAVENRWVSFIGATTENPIFSVVSPLLSRSLLLTLQPLDDEDIRSLIDRALADERGLDGASHPGDEARGPPGPAGRRRRPARPHLPGGGRRSARRPSTRRPWSAPSTAPRSATTGTATSTTT